MENGLGSSLKLETTYEQFATLSVKIPAGSTTRTFNQKKHKSPSTRRRNRERSERYNASQFNSTHCSTPAKPFPPHPEDSSFAAPIKYPAVKVGRAPSDESSTKSTIDDMIDSETSGLDNSKHDDNENPRNLENKDTVFSELSHDAAITTSNDKVKTPVDIKMMETILKECFLKREVK